MTATLLPPRERDADQSMGTAPTAGGPGQRGRLARMVRGAADDPSWVRPGLLVLLAGTALLYLWNLSASGYANSFYAAAVQAGTHSWKAWFFGSLDSGNSITVDKPPASLWVMVASARLFGFNSWSLLVPQALEGVAAVGLLYGAVRRVAGPAAGLLAGGILALTPAAVLMFRFDNPDALLVLLLVAAAYAVTRALEAASTRWMMLAGAVLGFAFLTKMLQGFLILPALAIVYLIAAPTSLRRRIGQVLLAGLALVAASGWWVAIVTLWPASSRPYIGGSTNNSVLNLVFGYNGLDRLSGNTGGGGGGSASAGSSFGGATGLVRLFSSEMGNEISWLLPAALVALVAGLWITRRAPRTDRARAALLLWGGWLLVTGLVFSYMTGVIHPYYTVALAPAIAALIGIGAGELRRIRASVAGRVGLVAMTVAAGGWAVVLLNRTSAWHPELRYLVVGATAVTVIGLLLPARSVGRGSRALVVSAVIAGLLGTGAFALATAAAAHTGSIPSVGPITAQTASAGGGGGAPTGSGGATTGSMAQHPASRATNKPATRATGSRPSGTQSSPGGSSGTGGSSTSTTAVTTALKKTTTTWAAATIGDQSAADLELASGKAVIAIGGWSGSDASPTLAQFKQYVAEGKITYFISSSGQAGGVQGGSAQSSVASQITAWVKAHYKSTTIGGQTVYVLTSAS